MKEIDLENLSKTDYNLKFFNYLEQFWLNYKDFNCLNKPKKFDLLLYLNDCEATYTTKDGQKLFAKANDVVYTPMNSEYTVEFYNFKDKNSSTLQINFYVYDYQNEQIKLGNEDVKIFSPVLPLEIKELFQKLGRLSFDLRTPPTQNKAVLFNILNNLNENKHLDKNLPIRAGIDYLHLHYAENPTIATLAKECRISEVYFRRIFKKETGKTPAEYRNKLRLDKAKEYLKYNDISIQEISENLGYSTVSHFIKQFKNNFGLSPLQFRLNNKT